MENLFADTQNTGGKRNGRIPKIVVIGVQLTEFYAIFWEYCAVFFSVARQILA